MSDIVNNGNLIIGLGLLLSSIIPIIFLIRGLKTGITYVDKGIPALKKVSKSDNKNLYLQSILSEFIATILLIIFGVLFITGFLSFF